MKETTVSKEDLLEKLKENRAKHKQDYDRAMKNWLKECKSSLKHRLRWFDKPKFKAEKFDLDFEELPKPVNYLSSYDTAIAQVEWETAETITLTEQDFRQFILNKWVWSEHYAETTSIYNSAKFRRP